MKKIVFHEEVAYLIALVLIALSVAIVAASDFGVSMIVGPAYILSLKFTVLTFGQAEYVVQGVLFVLMCILVRKVKPAFFFSFITCLIYGVILDAWRAVIPAFNPSVTTPGDFSMPVRILMFVVGTLLTEFAVALIIKVYVCPQVYDYFVKVISKHFNLNFAKFKTFFDTSCLVLSVVLTLIFFGEIRGIGIGTLITTAINGTAIGFFGHMLDKFFEFKPLLPKAKNFFEN